MTNINKTLLQVLYDGMRLYYNQYGNIKDAYFEYDDVEELREYYGNIPGVGAKVFDATRDYLENLVFSAEYYDEMLELHDRHTLWDVYGISDLDWVGIVDIVAEKFKVQTGVTVYFEGRSGRHICVDITLDNLINYDKLVETALDLEDEAIEMANNLAKEYQAAGKDPWNDDYLEDD